MYYKVQYNRIVLNSKISDMKQIYKQINRMHAAKIVASACR